MKNQKLTRWFPDSINPVRSGVYQVKFPGSDRELYSRWSKGFWRKNAYDKNIAAMGTEHSYFARAMRGSMQWRGVAK